ncbi:hypothetical protein HMPREF0591_4173 [Mycobacterium parascrofulaceum ATCC BAA-614]|uniref:Uncharacterized protein n=1 Tax=Mycobacterium parascrofulaceum ATCC BAA-614 TaxID=525368 RepID=D5PDC9_9MYCO|nr:hypothetical protein HMPREF0591_4173 [Mycobacterium parascrofulaceum ATCC BAA-614]
MAGHGKRVPKNHLDGQDEPPQVEGITAPVETRSDHACLPPRGLRGLGRVGLARTARLLLTLGPRRSGGQRPKVPTRPTEGPFSASAPARRVTTPPGSPRRACAPERRTRRPDRGRERWAAPG